MRHTEFWARLDDVLGRSYSRTWAGQTLSLPLIQSITLANGKGSGVHPSPGLSRAFGEAGSASEGPSTVRISYAARTRARSRSKFARPYLWRLIALSRFTCPSTGPLLQGSVSADSTAFVSRSSPVMKLRNSANAGFGGWIWAEYERDGRVRYSTAGRGAACSSCHSPGIDYTRMNDTHP